MEKLFEKLSTEEAFETVVFASIWNVLYVMSEISIIISPFVITSIVLAALLVVVTFMRLKALKWSILKLFTINSKGALGKFFAVEGTLAFVALFMTGSGNEMILNIVHYLSAIMLITGLVGLAIAGAKE